MALTEPRVTIEGGWFEKYMTVSKLIDLLSDIDGNLKIYPNRVGNLSIVNKDDDFLKYIDFNDEEIYSVD